jgi:hypothetical protein
MLKNWRLFRKEVNLPTPAKRTFYLFDFNPPWGEGGKKLL